MSGISAKFPEYVQYGLDQHPDFQFLVSQEIENFTGETDITARQYIYITALESLKIFKIGGSDFKESMRRKIRVAQRVKMLYEEAGLNQLRTYLQNALPPSSIVGLSSRKVVAPGAPLRGKASKSKQRDLTALQKLYRYYPIKDAEKVESKIPCFDTYHQYDEKIQFLFAEFFQGLREYPDLFSEEASAL